jgi:hypothetical protein
MNIFNTQFANELRKSSKDFVVCGEEFDISVTYSMEVAECGDPTDDEQQKMMRGLMREWRRKANAECEKPKQCSYPELVHFEAKKELSVCKKNTWSMTAVVTTKCVA